jgi:hypothetical protein
MSKKYDGVDAFVPGIGTVRECIDCGALIAGGPTRCIRCVKEGPPKEKGVRKIVRLFSKLWRMIETART